MSEQLAAFDKKASEFLSYYETVRGHVREQVTRINLTEYITEGGLNCVDIGGGDGRDAEWLREMGHEVLIVDPSFVMLEQAKKRDPSTKTIKGTASTLLDLGMGGNFDLVLSHGVLMYDLRSPTEHISELAQLVKPNGIVSILTKGYYAARERVEKDGDPEAIEEFECWHQFTNNLGEKVWALKPSEVINACRNTGLETRAWFGVRIATEENRDPIERYSAKKLESMVAYEVKLSKSPVRKGEGQMFHFIVEKSEEE